ncbi:MAG: glycerol-3-phosphate 1-O-acyltransferase PlsY [Candidatus Pelagibacterales bacterium]|jgi:glycerol-3-phosphate acyltransferase PlsY|tara:strand:+ start:32 stop:607 length:576 start_codon:yes stop_codon:yes gene_type:complete
MINIFGCIIISYLLGSIPSGIIIAKLFNLGDIRKIGSGNTGATNVLRTGNYKASAITLLLDVLKAIIAIKACELLFPDTYILSALFILIGHIFPVWLKKFSGGKGYASFLGIMIATNCILFFITISIWIICFLIFRISSLSALISTLGLMIAAYLLLGAEDGQLYFLISMIILISHGKNIFRLLGGTEKPL